MSTEIVIPGISIRSGFELELRRVANKPLSAESLRELIALSKIAQSFLRLQTNPEARIARLTREDEEYDTATVVPQSETFGANILREMVASLKPPARGIGAEAQHLIAAYEGAKKADMPEIAEALLKKVKTLVESDAEIETLLQDANAGKPAISEAEELRATVEELGVSGSPAVDLMRVYQDDEGFNEYCQDIVEGPST